MKTCQGLLSTGLITTPDHDVLLNSSDKKSVVLIFFLYIAILIF